MSRRFNITPNADRDIEEAVHWYEAQEAGLGRLFLRELRARFEDLLRNPELFRPVGRREIRKARIWHWPHSIYFRLLPCELRIVCIWHGARDPKELNYRLR